jgi:serine/threonine protein phosphatase PrpC
VRIGKSTKQGLQHLNEDRLICLDSLSELLDEDVMEMSQALELFSNAGKTFLDTVMLCCVFDGHGGSGCAEYVSTHLQNNLAKILDKQKIHDMDKASAAFLQAWGEVENEFLTEALAKNDMSGSCAVAALVWGKELLIAHCGDCRAVLRTSEGETIQLTKDHRASDPAERIRIETSGGVIIEDRVYGVLAPSRSFGDLDMKDTRGVVIAEPDVVKYLVRAYPSTSRKYTFMILASDGVWDVMSSESACDYVSKILTKNNGNADLAASKLVSMCSKYNQDDVTAAVIVWQTPSFQSSGGTSGEEPLSANNHTSSTRRTISSTSPVTSPQTNMMSGRKAWSMNKKDGATASLAVQAQLATITTTTTSSKLNGIVEDIPSESPGKSSFPSHNNIVGMMGGDGGGAESGYESDDVAYPELQKKGLKSIFSQAKLKRKT